MYCYSLLSARSPKRSNVAIAAVLAIAAALAIAAVFAIVVVFARLARQEAPERDCVAATVSMRHLLPGTSRSRIQLGRAPPMHRHPRWAPSRCICQRCLEATIGRHHDVAAGHGRIVFGNGRLEMSVAAHKGVKSESKHKNNKIGERQKTLRSRLRYGAL